MSDFKIGVAQVDCTPPIGLPLQGNSRDDYAARGVHDPLCSRAIVFADSAGNKAALVTVDVCMLSRRNVKFMRECISRDSGITNVLISATHTHGGPAMDNFGTMHSSDVEAVAKFLEKASSAVALADSQLADVSLHVGYGSETRVSFNRRLWCKDGKTHMNWEGLDPEFVEKPLGPIDPELIALSIEQDGKMVGTLVNFALHPAVLAGDNWLYSADYPGYLAEGVRRLCGSDVITAFFNGCCGNVNHIDYSDRTQGRGYQMTQRIGYMLSVGVHEALQNASPMAGSKVAVSQQTVPLERIKITDEQKQWAEKVLADLGSQPQGQVDGLPDSFYATQYLEFYNGPQDDDLVEVMAIRIGDLGIVGLPGEIFCKFGMEIKKNSPAKHTVVIELANDSIGYVATQNAYDEGGYEPTTGVTSYVRGSGERLVASALAQLEELFKE